MAFDRRPVGRYAAVMLGITSPWTFLIGTVAIVLLPGPNTLFVLSVAGRFGVRAGYRAAAGVWLGDSILMTLSAAGAASLLHAYPALFAVVKWAGAAYLAYVGLRQVISTWRRRSSSPVPSVGPAVFRRSVVVSLLNPKAILFFVSFFVQFVDPSYGYPAVSFLVLGVIVEMVSALYLSVLIFGGSFVASQFRARERLSRWLSTLLGAVFIGFGVRLATSSLG
jgi:leucine efflux protein